jgi:hypothetical protein
MSWKEQVTLMFCTLSVSITGADGNVRLWVTGAWESGAGEHEMSEIGYSTATV